MKQSIIRSNNLLEPFLESMAAFPALVEEVASLRGELAELRKLAVAPKVKEKKWLKLNEAAAALNTSPKSVRRYIEKGFLHRSAASRHILIPEEDVENFKKKVII